MLSYEEYIDAIKAIPFGKKVGKNLYVLWPDLKEASPLLSSLIAPLGKTEETTLIKFFLDQYKFSFLQYPDFFKEPHPALKESETLNLNTGKRRKINYAKQENPPILHRKETMISPDRKEYKPWKALTVQLEDIGCYKEPKKIGFKKFWDILLETKGYQYDGHCLTQTEKKIGSNENEFKKIDRYKTAMSRADFSRPVQFLLKYGLLDRMSSYFDYGCGLGDDIRALQFNDYKALGWDPVHAPEGKRVRSDIVNLGFVLNVIEDPQERIETLHKAFNLSKKILLVAVVTDTSPTAKDIRPYGDGFLTSRGTFQKYFKHEEAQECIEETLNCSSHAIAPGIFLVFKKETDAQDFLSSRQKRRVDWNKLNMHIYPSKDERDTAKKEILYQKHRNEIESYWEKLLDLGRLPTENDYPEGELLKQKINLNAKRLQDWFLERYERDSLQDAFNKRKDDLLVYLGLANFKRKIPYTGLSPRLQQDMKTFFGSYKAAQQEALVELFKIGKPKIIESQCSTFNKNTGIGVLDEQALFIKADEINLLDPILRMYVGTAGLLYGDIDEVDEIKIHKLSGKVTFLIHNPPDLKPGEYFRIKVDLLHQKIYTFRHKD